jgi:formylglycine-generating enzyme required for sulfatase activity
LRRGGSLRGPVRHFLSVFAAALLPVLAPAPGRAQPGPAPAIRLSAPAPAATLDLGSGVTLDFVLIPAGSFAMGSDETAGSDDESPRHRVTISRPYYLGRTEVTQEQWSALMDANPSKFRGAQLPVDSVSWLDCQAFLARLHVKTGRTVALPTEAQWEYAARAGAATAWSFGAHEAPAADHAWFADNSGGTTHPVGQKKPNAWGLYDMSGNVAEWCADWYSKHTYSDPGLLDPAGPATGDSRVVRGGSWGDATDYLRCAYRNCNGPTGATWATGLRVVLLPEPPR